MLTCSGTAWLSSSKLQTKIESRSSQPIYICKHHSVNPDAYPRKLRTITALVISRRQGRIKSQRSYRSVATIGGGRSMGGSGTGMNMDGAFRGRGNFGAADSGNSNNMPFMGNRGGFSGGSGPHRSLTSRLRIVNSPAE
jgi:hypothetical protein